MITLRSVSGRNWYVTASQLIHLGNSAVFLKTRRALLKRRREDERRGELGLMYLGLIFVSMLAITSRAWFPVFNEVKSQLYTLVLSN